MEAARSLELIARDGSTLRRIRERIPTYLSDFREDPRWLLMFVLGRTALGRRTHRRRPCRAATELPVASMFSAAQADIVQALRQDGLFQELRLPEQVTLDIASFASVTGCFGNHDRNLDLAPAEHLARQDARNPVTSGHYFERVQDCPAVMRIQSDPLLHAVAKDYLGSRATVISTRLWWSFPAPAERQPGQPPSREMLHFDLDDWRMLKYFFYITPVDAESGPHLYMRGTHENHVLKHQLSLTVGRPMDEVVSTYGAHRLVRLCGAAGSGFAEDPFGYHAGSLARITPRLMLEIGFGITPPNRRRFFGERVLSGSTTH